MTIHVESCQPGTLTLTLVSRDFIETQHTARVTGLTSPAPLGDWAPVPLEVRTVLCEPHHKSHH